MRAPATIAGLLALSLGLVMTFDADARLTLDEPEADTAQLFSIETWWPVHEDDEFPLPIVFAGEPTEGFTMEEVTDALEAAIQTWNDISCSTATLSFEGTRASFDSDETREVQVYFATGRPDEPPCVPTAERRCSIGETLYPPYRIKLDDDNFRWDTRPHPFQPLTQKDDEPTTVDLQAVLTHELGHVLGMGHIELNKAAAMSGQYLRDGGQRRLAAADKLAMCSMYPDPDGAECAGNSDCGPGASCEKHEVGAVCDKELGAVGDYCALDLLYCTDRCLVDPTGTGYCSMKCTDDDQCPAHFECLELTSLEDSHCLLTGIDYEPRRRGCSTSAGRPFTGQPLGSIPFMILLGSFVWLRRRH
ncbi:MAG: matrixin family metalloprotease [Bradymonadaceae bacterium]